MKLSSSPRTYVPQSLPLTGDNYQIGVRKSASKSSRTITKFGPVISVASNNPAKNLDIRVSADTIAYRRGAGQASTIRQNGRQINIQKSSGQTTTMTMSPDGTAVAVDRPGVSNDVIFTKTQNGLNIDRYQFANDVSIRGNETGVSFEYGLPQKNTYVSLTPGVNFDPVAFQEETTLHPHGLAILNDWFEQGQMDATDLITLTQRGDLLEADGLLR